MNTAARHGVVLRLHRLALRAVPPVLRRELRTQGEGGMNIHGGTVRYLVLTTLGRGGSFLNCDARRPGRQLMPWAIGASSQARVQNKRAQLEVP